ncbi:MAG: hypothetical protein HY706_16130 [Candidatus Hydrogenedentes bacterium]|nr:hypothetical protein [Candidatus Hydrogenedentota bacterium]
MQFGMPWKLGCLVGGTIGAVVALLCQLVPPYNVLGHEFTTAFCFVSGPVLYGFAGLFWRRVVRATDGAGHNEQLHAVLLVMTVFGLVMAFAALVVMGLFNEFRHHCYFGRGMLFFWVTWLPLAVLMSVLGIWTSDRKWGWFRRPAFLAAVIFTSFVHDWLQVESGVRPVDLLIGVPLGFDQRADIYPPYIHLYQRLWILLLAGALWFTMGWRRSLVEASDTQCILRISKWTALILWGLVALYGGSIRSYGGIGWGYGKLHGTLSEVHESEHFIFRYAPNGDASDSLAPIERYAEWNWKRLMDTLGIRPEGKVLVNLMDNSIIVKELTGGTAASAAPWVIMLPLDSALSETMYHELAHALDSRSAREHLSKTQAFMEKLGRLKSIMTFEMIFYRGRFEGMAQAFSGEYAALPEAHRIQAVALAEGRLPRAWEFMGFDGFRRIREHNAYEMAGSFMGFLILEYGMDKMIQLLNSTQDYQGVYGQDWKNLDGKWRDFLSKIPVPEEKRTQALENFDVRAAGGFNTSCCPKLGTWDRPREESAEDRASRLWRSGDSAGALAMYEQLFTETAEPHHRFQAAQILRSIGDYQAALELLDALQTGQGVTSADRLKYAREQRLCLMHLRDWERLYALLDNWQALEAEPGQDTRRIHEALRNESYRDAVAVMLTTDDGYLRRKAAEDLANRFPDDDTIAYFFLTRVSARLYPGWRANAIGPVQRAQLEELLLLASARREAMEQLAQNLQLFATRAISTREFELAERIVELIRDGSTDPIQLHWAQVTLARITFEREYALAHQTASLAPNLR